MAVVVNSLGNLSLGSSFPSSEDIFQAIRIAKEKKNYAPLCSIVEKYFSQKELFNGVSANFPSKALFKSVSCLTKSDYWSDLRPQLQKCLQLVLRHCDRLNATPVEKQFLRSKRDLCFQCRDGIYSINKLLFRLAFPEYYQAFTHFTKNACQTNLQGQLSLVSGSQSSEGTVENSELPFSVFSIQFLEHWLLGTDYESHLGDQTVENGLDLYCLGKEYLSKDLQERAFDFIRSRIGYALNMESQMCRSPDWITALLSGIAISGAKTSPFFIRLKKEILDLEEDKESHGDICEDVLERLMRTYLGSWSVFAQNEWKVILDHQHLCGKSFPIVRSYLDVYTHRKENSLEGALSRTLLATHKEDPQLKLCVGYSTDSGRDILTNQAMCTAASLLEGMKIPEEYRCQTVTMQQLLREEDVLTVKLSGDRGVTPSEFISLKKENSLAGIYLREIFLKKTMRVEIKSSRDLEDFMRILSNEKGFIEGVSTISFEGDMSIPKEFPRHPLIPGSVEIVQRTGTHEEKIPRDRDWERQSYSVPMHDVEDFYS